VPFGRDTFNSDDFCTVASWALVRADIDAAILLRPQRADLGGSCRIVAVKSVAAAHDVATGDRGPGLATLVPVGGHLVLFIMDHGPSPGQGRATATLAALPLYAESGGHRQLAATSRPTSSAGLEAVVGPHSARSSGSTPAGAVYYRVVAGMKPLSTTSGRRAWTAWRFAGAERLPEPGNRAAPGRKVACGPVSSAGHLGPVKVVRAAVKQSRPSAGLHPGVTNSVQAHWK
jgi:hypothetical protein